MAKPIQGIQVTSDLRSYFAAEIIETARRQDVCLSPSATLYLAQLLTKFADAKNYLVQNDPDDLSERQVQQFPRLALLWLESLSHTMTHQLFQLQHLGDVALFTSGFFAERIEKTLVDRDYYMAMGGMAYEKAGQIRESIQSERALNVYFELSANFAEFVEIFAEVSDQSQLNSDRDLVRLYEKWLKTGSGRISRMLAQNGIIPHAQTPKGTTGLS